MKRLMIATTILLSATVAQGQTTTHKLAWDQSEAPTVLANVAWTLKVDTGTPSVVTPTCVAKGSGSTCSVPIPSFTTTGPHTVTITGDNGFGPVSGSLTGSPMSPPVNITVSVTITIP